MVLSDLTGLPEDLAYFFGCSWTLFFFSNSLFKWRNHDNTMLIEIFHPRWVRFDYSVVFLFGRWWRTFYLIAIWKYEFTTSQFNAAMSKGTCLFKWRFNFCLRVFARLSCDDVWICFTSCKVGDLLWRSLNYEDIILLKLRVINFIVIRYHYVYWPFIKLFKRPKPPQQDIHHISFFSRPINFIFYQQYYDELHGTFFSESNIS